MADSRHKAGTCPSPLGGAALRQAQERDRCHFSGPLRSHDDSGGLWTQFSGMPNQPGSPTSLHEWLQTVDDASLAGNVSPGVGGFPATSSSPAGSRGSPFDFLNGGIGQDRGMHGPPQSSMGHHFDFGSSPDFGSPPVFSAPHSPQFSHSSVRHFSVSSTEMSGLQPDFSHPPPDISFGAQPDFTHPPPSFMTDVPPLHPTADAHQGLSDFLAAHSKHSYPHQDASLSGACLGSSPPSFDAAGPTSRSVPRPHGITPGHIDVTLPPPRFTPFPVMADDVFQGSVDFEGIEQNHIPSFESVGPVHKKVIRQNSEPAQGKTAAEEGAAMYVEALRRLNSFGPSGPSYEPFGSMLQPQDDAVETGSTFSDDAPPSKNDKRKEPPKPSYSDVAKATRGRSSQSKAEGLGNERGEMDGFLKTSADPVPPPKPYRNQTFKRQHSHSRATNQRTTCSHIDSGHGNYVQPNSRYGLDQFEDVPDFVRAEQRSNSMESLNSQVHPGMMRRSSNSSLSSSTSAVEESHLRRSSGTSGTVGVDGRGSRNRSSSSHLNGKEAAQDYIAFNYNTNISNSSTIGSGQPPHKVSTSPTPHAAQKLKNEKVFFDPKRIFQSRPSSKAPASVPDKAKASEDRKRCDGEGATKEETVLNNGKPNNTTSKASAATHRKADYINNDLREAGSASTGGSGSSGGGGGGGGGKRTNQTAAFNRHSHGSRKHSSKDVSQNGSSSDRSKGGDSRGRRQDSENEDGNSFIRNIDWVLVDEWMKYISDCCMTFARNSVSAVLTLLFYLLGVIMYLALGAIHLIALGVGRLWSMVRSRLFKDQGSSSWAGFAAGAEAAARRRFGVEENITLPGTGEEAMKRLLACKGKDPYSILGLRADASDEDIKRYYRRQAVLVHPDKNQEPGAEEAFKILGHAFEMIGEPAKRKEYDAHIFEASEAEAAMREFSDLLTKLQEKVQEAANMMRCDHCGGKHRRVPVDRPWYSARFCNKCNIRHSAKEGDVWAESSMLGFLWHYYACMDNSVYDITDWVSCQSENFKHMKANAHPVFYRIQTDSNRRHRQGQSGEADLEDFINRLFNKASMSPDGASQPGWQFPSQQAGAGASQSWGAPSSTSSSSSNSKRSRRKKKRN